MSDSLLSFTIIFAELGGVLLLVAIGWAIYYILNARKESKSTRELIVQIKKIIPTHREKLATYFKDEPDLEQSKIDFNIETLIKDERKIYERLVQVSLTKDISLLKLTTDDINLLINDYVRLLALNVAQDSDDNKASRDVKLKKENEALRLDNTSLQTRLTASTETIENMMGEFSSMYEGGKKEGEQRVKNEMYKLRQSLDEEEARHKSETKDLEKKDE